MRAGFRLPTNLSSKSVSQVATICLNVRKRPGDNNHYERKNIDADQQEKMEQTVLWCRYMYLTSRDLDLAEATEDRLEQVSNWMNGLGDNPDENSVEKYKDGINKRNWLESFQGYFASLKGAAKVPVAYVVRDQDAPPAEDEGFGLPTFGADLKTRGRLGGRHYRADNTRVWTVIASKCRGTTAWTIISAYERQENGRAAYRALVAQFMGPDIERVLQSQALTFLNNAVFRGDNRNFTFDKFIGRMRQAFIDLGPEDQCTEARKVRELMKAWQVSYLDHLDPHVLNNPQINQNFEAAVSFLGDQLANKKVKHSPGNNNRTARNLGAMGSGNKQGNKQASARKGNQSKHKFDPKNPHKFLKGKAWWDLTDAQREEARKARLKRGIQPTKNSRNVSTVQTEEEVQVEKVVPPQQQDIKHLKGRTIKMTQRHD